MALGSLIGLIPLALLSAHTPTIDRIAGLPRESVIKILGKPGGSVKHLKLGVTDKYKLPGFNDARFDYSIKDGKFVPIEVRFTLAKHMELMETLKTLGIDTRGASIHKSVRDGSMLVENAPHANHGWIISFWIDNTKMRFAHIDFRAPGFM